MDTITEEGNQIEYAICIEIEATFGFPNAIDLAVPTRETIIMDEKYQRKPQICKLCKGFDHVNKEYAFAPKEEPKIVTKQRKMNHLRNGSKFLRTNSLLLNMGK